MLNSARRRIDLRGRCLSALVVAVIPIALAAQLQRPPAFRTGTTLVEVDVIVDDGDGRFVGDLPPTDFTVLEDGKPQTIETMYVVLGTTVRSVKAAPAVPPGAAAAPETMSRVRQTFVLLFDTLHIGHAAAERARAAAEAFLEKDFRPGDIGGIVAGGRMANKRLTSDRAELVAAIRAMRPDADALARRNPDGALDTAGGTEEQKAERGLAGEAARNLAETVERGRALEKDGEAGRQETLAINSLQGVVKGLAHLPGRKNVVVFSDGVRIGVPAARRIVDAAVRASVGLYIIDTRGLNHGFPSSALLEATQPDPIYVAEPGTRSTPPWRPPMGKNDIDSMLTRETGGLLVSNHNNFAKALSIVAADSTSYYVLGYRPGNPTADGRFRTIEVRVQRKGVTVRARKGYFATAGGAR